MYGIKISFANTDEVSESLKVILVGVQYAVPSERVIW